MCNKNQAQNKRGSAKFPQKNQIFWSDFDIPNSDIQLLLNFITISDETIKLL